MYIKKIKIEDLRCFKEIEMLLSPGINIILGFNNSGKSTLIRALYTMQEKNCLQKNDIRIGKDELNLYTTITGIGPKDRSIFGDLGSFKFSDRDELTISCRMTEKEAKSTIIEDDPRKIEERQKVNKVFGPNAMDLAIFNGFPNREDKGNFIYPFFNTRRRGMYNAQQGKEVVYAVYDNQNNLPGKVQKTSSQATIGNLFRQLSRDILGTELVIIPGDAHENKLGTYSMDETTISIDAMGDGVPNIIGFLTILLTRNGKLFLIEELENDIHPLALKKLLNHIVDKSKENQIIISTHSHIVLKHLGASEGAKIFYVESDDNQNIVPTSTVREVPNSPRERQIVLEQLGYDLGDYDLYKGYLIFEESSAERIVREFIFPWFVPKLVSKVRTIAAQGADDLVLKYNDLHSLFVYLHLSPIYKDYAWVIADGDEKGKKIIGELKNKYKAAVDSNQFCNFREKYFENYYPARFQPQVTQIMAIQDKKQRQKRKIELLNEVVAWLSNNDNEARTELNNSAKEVINILKKIETILCP